MTTPPGWYPDNIDPSRERYWDGEQWTATVRNQRSVPDAPAPVAPAKGQSWFAQHKLLTAAGVVVILVAFGIAGSSGNGSNKPSASTSDVSAPPSQAPAPVATQSSPGPSADTKAARGWINKNQHCWNEVQVAVQAVQAGLSLLNSNSSAADTASFSQLLQQSHDYLDEAQACLVDKVDGHMHDQRLEAWDAAYKLRDAMAAARHYLDDQKPSQLADFQSRYQGGVSEWNDAVTALWSTAGIRKPPTV